MKHYEAIIKEKLNENVLKPSYHGTHKTKDDLIKLWGLDQPDIEWYELYEVLDNGKKIKL